MLIPYEGTIPPKVTHIGTGDKDNTKTLQQGYYGGEAGKGRNAVGKLTSKELGRVSVGSAWRVAAYWLVLYSSLYTFLINTCNHAYITYIATIHYTRHYCKYT